MRQGRVANPPDHKAFAGSISTMRQCLQQVVQVVGISLREGLLAGIETHVCVYQTARDLLARGYEVHVVADGVSSRTVDNRHIALERMQADGAHLASTEMVPFELLQRAEGPAFKEILGIVK
ncbi:MAG: isochorismatase family protein [Chloroflexota bacterium]|nr:isochorismatase family protein [Chloroflexota bacterium]